MRRYDGKNAWWLYLIILLYNVLPILLCFYDLKWNAFTSIIFVCYYAFDLVWFPIVLRNRIELYESYFLFYYGFSKVKIMLTDIKKIEKSRDSIASSANSLDRIYIDTGKKDFYVSLKDNDDFIQEVNKRR